jgi:MFS family permease
VLRGRSLFYGWVVVGTITTMLMATNGARLLFGVVLKPMSDEFSWQRSTLTGAVLVNMVVLSLVQPFGGWLTDRLGPKRVMVGGTALIALTLIPFSLATELWQIYLVYGLIGGIAFTAASPVNASALVNRWFVKRRGTALSLAMAGTPVGQLIIVPIAAVVLAATDWQTTYRLLALLLVLMIPLGAWLLREDPAEIGEVPDGRRGRRTKTATPGAGGESQSASPVQSAIAYEPAATLRQALRSSAFWLLAYGFVVCGFTMAFANTHFLAYADDMGMHTSVATTAISVTAIFSVIGTIVLGVVADRTDRAPVLALTYALRGVAFLLLYAFETGPLIYLYAVVLGVSWSATTPLTAAIAADIYGRQNLGVIFGTMFTAMNLGFGIGAYLDGVIFDAVGEYHPAVAINGLAGLSAAVAIYVFSGRRAAWLRSLPTGDASAPAPATGD